MDEQEHKAALDRARLYGILDTGYADPHGWTELTVRLIDGGVGLLQIRAKGAPIEDILSWAREIVPLAHERGVPVIINDHPELVEPSGAAGVHIGQDDGTIAGARARAGRHCLVGKSTHSPAQARQAQADGADYIGFGPLFSTPTKPGRPAIGIEAIPVMATEITIPAFCIGGIKRENLPGLVARGATRVVIVSGLLTAADPAAYAREVVTTLSR